MIKQVIFMLIFVFLTGFFLQTVVASPDIVVPGPQVVLKPPDLTVPLVPVLPSLVNPESPVSGFPVCHPSMDSIQSPVRSGLGDIESESGLEDGPFEDRNRMNEGASYAPDQVIVKYKSSGISVQSSLNQIQAEVNAFMGATVLADSSTLGIEGMQVVQVPNSTGTMKAIEFYKMNPMVAYAEPDYILHTIDNPSLKVSIPESPAAVNFREQVRVQKPLADKSFDKSNKDVQQSPIIAGNSPDVDQITYGIMHISPDKKLEMYEHSLQNTPKYSISSSISQGSKSLLSSLPYVPSERNQGNCGNCWVWAATGAIEIAHTIQTDIKDRLSIQYFNSNYEGGSGYWWACTGGWSEWVADFYNNEPFKQVIPWSNPNASYADANACPSGDCSDGTVMPADQITTTPRYPISEITTSEIPVWEVSKEEAINNLKSQIDQNKAIWWAFFLPNATSWQTFSAYWWSQPESALWNPDPYNDIEYGYDGGGHAVLIVGYDDTSQNPDEWYWIAVNSWGTTPNRPSGLFRVKMNMDYDGRDTDEIPNHFYSVFDVTYLDPSHLGSIQVSSIPEGAKVWLDGSDTSHVTPTTLVDIPHGSHVVGFAKTGYKDAVKTVSVTGGVQSTISATLNAISEEFPAKYPNDPSFSLLYGLHNKGQSINGVAGISDADIDAPQAWVYTTGSSNVVVAVIDTGVDYTHPDLSSNCISGYDFLNEDDDPMDDHGHGTHCAGTIGAVGNNGIGIAGVNWNVQIMPLKFLGSDGSGYTSDAIECIQYAHTHGAQVLSNSWGGGGYSQALKDAIDASPAVVICAAGNNGLNIDKYYAYPAGYSSENIISVAATDNRDNLAYFSNYGIQNVDVAAPGVNIYSTIPGNQYRYSSGTSMATPHVAGVAALVKAAAPEYTSMDIKKAIFDGVDVKVGLSGKCLTSGRVNVGNVLKVISGPVSVTAIGVFRGRTWYLDETGNGAWGTGDSQKTFGLSGDIPVTGDWNGDGKTEIGVFRVNKWYLDYNGNGIWDGPSIDRAYTYGISGDIPVAGDWNGDGKNEIGVFRVNKWYFDYNGNGIWDGPSIDRQSTFGLLGDNPVTGDWNGDGKTEIGVFRVNKWYLDYNGNGKWDGPSIDRQSTFGLSGDKPIIGDWNGDGKNDIGVFRVNKWYLDFTGNGAWGRGDKQNTFGFTGDIPVTGEW